VAGYARKTALSPAEVFARAAEILPARIGLAPGEASNHGATYAGKEGKVTLEAHSHSFYTEVTAHTDQLRTSRVDYEIQRFLSRLPYEVGDRGGPGSGEPSGLLH
jgi:hypothetical protein